MHHTIGFIGQGWIGKHYADDFEARGYPIVRYALEEKYLANKDKLAACDIVFIAVPTPTTPEGFDDSIVRAVLPLVGKGKVAVIKSTLLPGTTKVLQKDFSDITLMHSPEFLREKTAAYDAAHPDRNIIGVTELTPALRRRAETVLQVLPDAPYEKIMDSTDAELVKYAGNCYLFTKVVFMNVLYDLIQNSGGDFSAVRDALIHDPRIGASHTEPVHLSGHDTSDGSHTKRGAGGHCFIKDFEAFKRLYSEFASDERGLAVLEALTEKNNELLVQSGKDLDLVEMVYGDVERYKKSSK